MANAKVIVTTRFVVDSKIIYTGSKLHDDSATVKLVIDTALEKAEQRAGSSLTCGLWVCGQVVLHHEHKPNVAQQYASLKM